MRLAAAARLLKARFGSYEEVLREIGKRTGEFNMASVVGRSAQLMFAADPIRLVRTLEELYKVSMSYSAPTVIWKGPRAASSPSSAPSRRSRSTRGERARSRPVWG